MKSHPRALSTLRHGLLCVLILGSPAVLATQLAPPPARGPVVDFAADATSGPSPLLVRFKDLSGTEEAEAWEWDFGDGNTSTERHPEHVYVEGGAFDVRLTIHGEHGQSTAVKKAFVRVDDELIVERARELGAEAEQPGGSE